MVKYSTRRSFRRRRPFRKFRRYGRYKSGKMFIKKVRYAMKAISERKNVDSSQNASIDTVGSILSLGLDGLPQGTTMNNRLGNEITLKSVHIRGTVFPGEATNTVRLLLVQWLSETASLTVVNNVLFNNATAGFDVYSMYAKEYSGKFNILWDRSFAVSNAAAPNIIYNHIVNRKMIKTIRYNSQVVGNLVTKGALFLIALSDSAAFPHPTISFSTRITFTDS